MRKIVTLFLFITALFAQAKGPDMINALSNPYTAPDFIGIQAWFNTKPLTMEQLKGKVVLVDFWTYSCINCVHTLPHLIELDKKYRDKGLVIVGVHSPEFEFEKDPKNIQMAIEKYGIKYPVAADSLMQTWTRYHNQYWPAQYLINPEGQIVYMHIGEGDQDILERNIQVLLDQVGKMPVTPGLQPVMRFDQTPETYLGASRAQRFSGIQKSPGIYQYPAQLPVNHWALEGPWVVEDEKIISGAARASLKINFNAQKVFLVMGTNTGDAIQVTLTLNNQPVTTTTNNAAGKDVSNQVVMVDRHTLYELIDQGQYQNGLLEIKADKPGLELYAFTFS